jgi:hypothetical protein
MTRDIAQGLGAAEIWPVGACARETCATFFVE